MLQLKRILFPAITGVFLLSLTTAVEARQQEAVNKVRDFVQAQEVLPRERIYLHTDRDWYFFGDRIWFSAYVSAGGYNYLSEISTLLYVELVAPNGDIIERVNVRLEEGRGSGSISFENARNKQEGVYQLRAFTKWATNFGDSYAHIKKLKVISEMGDDFPKTQDGVTDVQFLPESGRLVQGLSTRLAFKAIGTDGLGRDVSGTIFEASGTQVTSFETQHNGMGEVGFTPEAGKSYYAMVDDQRVDLPAAVPSGLILNVEGDGSRFNVQVQNSPDLSGQQYLLFAHVRGVVYHAGVVNTSSEATTVNIPTEKFATGVVHFTLLDSRGNPVAERLAFNKNPISNLDVRLGLSATELDLREDASVSITVRDAQGQPMSATGSVSVFDDGIESYQPYRGTINTKLSLESELRGYVEDPGYYFSEAPDADRYLDLLMMTQGWRVYDMANFKRVFDPMTMNAPEQGFTVSGVVERRGFGRALANAPVLLSLGRERRTYTVTADENGRFTISDLDVEGQEDIAVKSSDEDGSDRIRINLDEQFSELPRQRGSVNQVLPWIEMEGGESLALSDNTAVDLNERVSQNQQMVENQVDVQMTGELDEITVVGESAQNRSRNFYSQALGELQGQGTQLDMDERPELINYSMDQVLNQMPGVSVIGYTIKVNTSFISFNTDPQPPIMIIDGVRVSEPRDLLELEPRDVESVTVARSAVDLALFGSEGAYGAIIVNTRPGTNWDPEDRGLERTIIYGYQQPTNFYAPKYGVNVPRDLALPDNRITLHWEPLLELRNGNAELRFWANDVPSTYRIVFEGITDSGIPFYTTGTFFIR